LGPRRDWDPAPAQPPRPGAPEVGRRHVPRLVQGAHLPLMEVATVEAVRLVACEFHLGGVGRRWLVWLRWKLCAAVRMGGNGAGGAFYSHSERWALNGWRALTLARALKRRLAAAGQSCRLCSYSLREARRRGDWRVETTKRREKSLTVGHVASDVPSRCPRLPFRVQGLDWVHRMKKCVMPDEILVW
jgi:hypothetical protein